MSESAIRSDNPWGSQGAEVLPQTALKQDRLGLLKNSAKVAFLTGSKGLNLVEKRIKSRFPSDAAPLTDISHYLLELGGKRIRPLLAILSGRLFGMKTPSQDLIDAAAGIELIHMATLLHDDIIDGSPTRRNQPSAFLKFGMPQTLLTGDFLLVKAFGLCAHLDKFIIEATEAACVELTEGEILEGQIDPNKAQSLDDYLNIVGKKTASLFALSATVGAHLAETDETNIEHLREFGLNAGIAFQMVDDILDITADEDLLGKPAGMDLRQKTPSLINILWINSGDPKAKEFFSLQEPSIELCKEITDYLVKQSDIPEQARALAKQYAARAGAALMKADDSRLDKSIRDQLLAIIEYSLERCL